MMGKTYVVFVGRRPSVYETWGEAHRQVDKFSGAALKSFRSKDEASKAFQSYIEKRQTNSSSDEDGSCATSSATTNRDSTEDEKLVKLKALILDLENENRNHVSRVARITKEIKQLIKSLEISADEISLQP